MIRILVADDQNVLRQALEVYLENEQDLEVIATADDGIAALQQIELLHPDVAIIDMEMPKMDGLTATKIISERFPNTKVLVLSSHDSEEYVYNALQAGAKGYLLKNTSAQELANVVRAVHQGYFQLGPGLHEKFLDKLNIKPLVAKDPQYLEANLDVSNVAILQEEVQKAIATEIDVIRSQLTIEFETDVNQIKKEVEQGLIVFQQKVSKQIQDGLSDLTNKFNRNSLHTKDVEEQRLLKFQLVRLRESYEQQQKQIILLRNFILIAMAMITIIFCFSFFSALGS